MLGLKHFCCIVLLVLTVTCERGNFDFGSDFANAEVGALALLADDSQPYDKRNNVNRFKNMMITKDNPEILSEIESSNRDGQIYYIPRVANNNGKKRGAILSWAIPANKMRIAGSNYRQTSSFGGNLSRPAAKK